MLQFLLACAADDPATEAGTPTFHEDVAPILAESCNSCHQDGAIAPMSLTTYAATEAFAGLIADDAEARIMPPWLADNSGACNTFQHANWLADDEIATLGAWVDGGAPEGDPSNGPLNMTPELVGLAGWTNDASLAEAYTPDFNETSDDYRCFLVDPGLDADAFLTGFEVIPGDPSLVHHVVVYGLYDQSGWDDALAVDAADPDNGYACFGDAGVSESFLVAAWAPGRQAWEYPDGTGIELNADFPLIVQMHYNDGGGVADQTVMHLRTSPTVERPMTAFFWANTDLEIPPGKAEHHEKSSMSFADYTGYNPDSMPTQEILAIAPHMHKMGVSEHASLVRGNGDEDCLLEVPRWDFDWQFLYIYDEPVVFHPEDKLKLDCVFDSTGVEETVYWGEGTGDEMCLLALFVADKQ